MDAGNIIGRWLYSDESSDTSDGTVLEFTKSSDKGGVNACFLMEDQAINAVMECTLTSEGIVIEEIGEEISNRYEITWPDDGRNVTGTWLCTKSSMVGEYATAEGDSGEFALTKEGNGKDSPPEAQKEEAKKESPAAEAKKGQEPGKIFEGRWTYSDDFTAASDGTLLEFSVTEDGMLSALFLVEESEPTPAKCELSSDGKGITIHEIGDYISNDYVGVMSSSGDSITGTWTCIKSEDEETAVGDSGTFTLAKSGQ